MTSNQNNSNRRKWRSKEERSAARAFVASFNEKLLTDYRAWPGRQGENACDAILKSASKRVPDRKVLIVIMPDSPAQKQKNNHHLERLNVRLTRLLRTFPKGHQIYVTVNQSFLDSGLSSDLIKSLLKIIKQMCKEVDNEHEISFHIDHLATIFQDKILFVAAVNNESIQRRHVKVAPYNPEQEASEFIWTAFQNKRKCLNKYGFDDIVLIYSEVWVPKHQRENFLSYLTIQCPYVRLFEDIWFMGKWNQLECLVSAEMRDKIIQDAYNSEFRKSFQIAQPDLDPNRSIGWKRGQLTDSYIAHKSDFENPEKVEPLFDALQTADLPVSGRPPHFKDWGAVKKARTSSGSKNKQNYEIVRDNLMRERRRYKKEKQ